jgi:hypothetical protein
VISVPDIAHVSTVSPTERFRECFADARDAFATVSALDREMTQCLDEMRQQNESPARMIAARAALDSIREVAALASRIAPQSTAADTRPNAIRVA